MSTTTTNLELVKPAGNERVDVDVINSNYDKIDEFAGLAITDANYVHTDNNYTTTEKNKLSAIQPNATATSFTQTLVSGTAVGTITINGTAYTIYAPASSGGASALNDLTDVTLANPSNGQVLKYNATTGKWENADESGGGGGYIPTGESYRFFTEGSTSTADYELYVQWTDGETVTTASIVSYSQIISGWTTGDYQNVTVNWDRTNQNFNFVAKSGSFECNGTYFDEGDTMGTLSSGNITFLAMEKEATGVDWTQIQSSGTKIAEIEIDGVPQNVYAPTPPTKTSDLTNDSNFVADASYVHTDNNYTATEKNKLSGLVAVEANPSGTASTDLTKIGIGGTNYNIPSGGSGSSTFAGLSDVDIDDSTLANGQVPVWNSTTEKWENGAGGGGTTVIANPTGTPTDDLNSIQIGNDIYEIPTGGGSIVYDLVPRLTADDSSSVGTASADGTLSSAFEPWHAFAMEDTFDASVNGGYWACGSSGGYLQFAFAEDVTIKKISCAVYTDSTFTLYYSSDDTNYTQGDSISTTSDRTGYICKRKDYLLTGPIPCKYIRFVATAEQNIGALHLYGDTGSGGTTVIPNPEGEATDTLTKIQIGDDIYEIPEELPWKDITGVLPAGETEIILSDDAITDNSTFEAFTDPIEVSHTDMVLANEPTLINDILSSADDTKVTASSFDTAEVVPWKAFDGIKGVSSGTYSSPYHAWLAGNADAPCWLQYHFATAKYIDEVKVYVYCNNGTYSGSAKVQGSNDGTSWTDISSAVSISAPYGEEIELDFTCNSNQYSYVRLYSESAFTVYGGASIFVGEMEIYGRSSAKGIKLTFPAQAEDLNVKVRITNSGNSAVGGGGSIDYSTEEQDTGIKWIDGKKVYQKSYTGTIGSVGANLVDADFPHNIIGVDAWFKDTVGRGMSLGDLNTSGWCAAIHVTHVDSVLSLVAYTGDALLNGTYTVTIRYTKSTT